MPDTVVMLPKSFTVDVDGVESTPQVSEATFAFDTQTATVRTLTGQTDLATGETCTLTLNGYSDWSKPEAESLCWTLWNAAGRLATFTVEAVTEDGVTVTATGTFQARRPPFGPTADDAARFALACPVIGTPTITRRATAAASSSGAK